MPVVIVALSSEQESGPSRGRVIIGVGATADAARALDFAFEAARWRRVGTKQLRAALRAVDRPVSTVPRPAER